MLCTFTMVLVCWYFSGSNLLSCWFCSLFIFWNSSLALQRIFKSSSYFSSFSHIFVCRVWFCAFSSMLSLVIIFFKPSSFSSIVWSFCICCFLSATELICIWLKLALRKAIIASSAVSFSYLNFRISVWYILFYFFVDSWIFCKFLYFVSTSVQFSSCSCFLISLIASVPCLFYRCSVSHMGILKYSFLCSSFTFVIKPSTAYPKFYS